VVPTRVHRSIRVILASSLASLLLVAMPGTEAHADPTVAEIEAQIAKMWADAEPLVEEYNGIHDKYMKNKAKQDDLAKKIVPLQRQVDLAQLRVGVIAAQVYKGGQADAFNAVLSSGSPKTLAEQLAFLDQLAREQDRQIAGVAALKAQYDAQKAPIDQLVTELAAQDADLHTRKAKIDTQIEQLEQLRIKAYGASGGTGSWRPRPCPSRYEPTNGYKAAQFACSQAGKPYVWAAAGPDSYDCSGLVLAGWSTVGVYLPHNAAAQRRSMPYVTKANLKVGDLVFYYDDIRHVAIYVGDDKVMQAPSPGDNVRMSIMEDVGPIHSYGRPS
jgi:cell wall-associated NlpC family hydrolase